MKAKLKIKAQETGIVGLKRKFWIPLAEASLKKRKELFGDEANTCEGCREILMCSGPISFQICQTIDKMMAEGLLKGPKKIPFRRMRAKFLPISEECLQAHASEIKKLLKQGTAQIIDRVP